MKASRRSPVSSKERPLPVGSLVALSAVLVISVMAIGGVHPTVLGLLFLISVISAGIVVARLGVGREAALVTIFLCLAGWSALQALTLPTSWLASIAPRNASVFAEALRPWRLPGPTEHSLSLDYRASWIEAARFVTYASTLIIAARVVRAYGAMCIVLLVFATSVVLAVTTLAHGILELRSVFGIYEPRYATPRWLSPLLNGNNLAGYLNLGFFCGCAALLSRKLEAARVPIILGLAVVLGVSLMTGSRGGLLSLFLGCAALAFLYRRHWLRWERRAWLQVGGVVGAAAVVIAVAAPTEALRGYRESSNKLDLFGWAGRMLLDHFWFGVGRGAFETSFTPYRGVNFAGGTNNVTFAHAENFLLQWASEWGVPVTVAALAGIVFSFWRCGRRRSSGLAFIATGLLVWLVQNLVDVASEVPGVCIAVVALCAVFFSSESSEPRRARAMPSRRASLAVGIAMTVLAASCAWKLARLDTVTGARDRLRALYDSTAFNRASSARQFDTELKAAVLVRPGEPYFHLLGAMAARRTRGEPNRWLSRALERDPTRAETYYVLGRVLLERGYTGQGFDAMRHALGMQPGLVRKVARIAAKSTHSPELLVRLAPEGKTGCQVLEALAARLTKAEKEPFLREAAARAEHCSELASQLAAALVEQLEDATQEACKGQNKCLQDAEDAIARAERSGVAQEQLRLLRARVLAHKADKQQAHAFLSAKCPPAGQDLDCSRLMLRLAAGMPESEPFIAATRSFLAAVCQETADCVKAEQLVGDLAAQRGDWILALAHHERAAKLSGSSAAWRRYSEVARKAGSESRAAQALKRAERYDRRAPSSEPAGTAPDDDDP